MHKPDPRYFPKQFRRKLLFAKTAIQTQVVKKPSLWMAILIFTLIAAGTVATLALIAALAR